MDKACPISFKIDILPQEFHSYCIRGLVVYSKAEHYHDNVERCINHQQKGNILASLIKYLMFYAESILSDQPNSLNISHVLRCDDSSSSYVDLRNKRHSVIVPLKPPAPGTQSVTLCFRFMCLSSCIGSLNRRPTKLIFTLETVT